MNWVIVSLLSTLLFAFVTILDKRLVAVEFPSVRAFNVIFGLLQFYVAAVAFSAVIPLVGFDGGSGIPWATASGVLWAVALTLFFHGLRLEEASRATPIQMTAPVFTAVVSVAFFDEVLNLGQWAMILVVVVGAALVNARPEGGRIRSVHGRALVLLSASAAVMAMAFIATDQATDRMNVWAVQAWRAPSMGTMLLALSLRPAVVAELRTVVRKPRAMALMYLTEGLMAPVAALTFVWAVSLGPVALVSAVTSSRPLFVLMIGTALSTPLWNVLHEQVDRETIGLKVIAIAMVIGGVVGLSLF